MSHLLLQLLKGTLAGIALQQGFFQPALQVSPCPLQSRLLCIPCPGLCLVLLLQCLQGCLMLFLLLLQHLLCPLLMLQCGSSLLLLKAC